MKATKKAELILDQIRNLAAAYKRNKNQDMTEVALTKKQFIDLGAVPGDTHQGIKMMVMGHDYERRGKMTDIERQQVIDLWACRLNQRMNKVERRALLDKCPASIREEVKQEVLERWEAKKVRK